MDDAKLDAVQRIGRRWFPLKCCSAAAVHLRRYLHPWPMEGAAQLPYLLITV
jgi:hypothetical protein